MNRIIFEKSDPSKIPQLNARDGISDDRENIVVAVLLEEPS